MYYKKTAQDGKESTIFINLDSVDSFTIHPKDDVTELYFVVGNDVHLVFNKKKLTSATTFIRRLLDLADRAYVNADDFVEDCNAYDKSKGKVK
jgi:Mg2+ and Co2+ transporter CorA